MSNRRYDDERRGPPDIRGMVSLKVDNLPYRMRVEDLRAEFERYGEIGDIYIPRDRYSKESRGFAFVRYWDQRDADDAIDAMDGKMMDGRELRVQTARHRRPDTAGGGGRGGRSGGRSRSRSRSRSRGRKRRSYSRSRSRSKSRSADRGDKGGDRDRRRSKSGGDRSRSKSR